MSKSITTRVKREIRQKLKSGCTQTEIIDFYTKEGFSEPDINYEIETSREDEAERAEMRKHKSQYYLSLIIGAAVLAFAVWAMFSDGGGIWIGGIIVGGGLFIKSLAELTR